MDPNETVIYTIQISSASNMNIYGFFTDNGTEATSKQMSNSKCTSEF